MTAFYNDNNEFAANWLEDLSHHGLIAPGRVDRRSITELTPADVAGPGQRHFFAGIGGWSYALRLAGVPDHLNIWTGSLPCQPLSDAGKGGGFLDPRHLWPAWFALIRECRPPVIFGEQVASRLGLEWLDLVFADLERCGYTVGAADLCAAGVGAPHQRQRLYFVAYADGEPGRLLLRSWRSRDANARAGGSGETCGLADTRGARLEIECEQQTRGQRTPTERGGEADVVTVADSGRQRKGNGRSTGRAKKTERNEGSVNTARSGGARDVAHAERARRQQGRSPDRGETGCDRSRSPNSSVMGNASGDRSGRDARANRYRRLPDVAVPPGATRGFWADAEWLLCRDPAGGPPVARPVEPGSFPLAHGVPQRVGQLSGYGNAIVPWVAVPFIIAALDSLATGKTDVAL